MRQARQLRGEIRAAGESGQLLVVNLPIKGQTILVRMWWYGRNTGFLVKDLALKLTSETWSISVPLSRPQLSCSHRNGTVIMPAPMSP